MQLNKIKLNKKIVVLLLFVFFALMLNCCMGPTRQIMKSLSQDEKDNIQSTIFQAPYDSVFQASVQVVQEKGYFVNVINKDLGIITTDWKEGPISDKEAEAMIYATFFWGHAELRRRININITKLDNNSTKIKIQGIVQSKTIMGWQGQEDDMTVEQVQKSCKVYFDAINQKISHK